MSQVQLTEHEDSRLQQPLLVVSNLSVKFLKQEGVLRTHKSVVRAVDDISFQVMRGEFISVVGESGSGKTTLARCLMNFTTPTSGTIRYNGRDTTRQGKKELMQYLQEVQMVFQDPFEALNPRHDVFKVVSSPLRFLLHERGKTRIMNHVHDLLTEVGLDPVKVMHRLPHQLSGGEKQRVNIARALAPNPKLLIADEPITMLDAAQRFNILSLLMYLRKVRNLTVIMITHDMASAKLTSDRIMVMYKGKQLEIGPASEVLTNPHHPYVELIVSATPTLMQSEKVAFNASDASEELVPSAMSKGCVFLARCKYSTRKCEDSQPDLETKSQFHLAACYNPLNCPKPEHSGP